MPNEPVPLEPLIPLDRLKQVVQAIARVPKDAIEKADADRPKRPTARPQKG
jgi:hypothetical protein